MAYFKETVRYGPFVDIKVYHTPRAYPEKAEYRRPARRETTASQQELNRKNAVDRLRRLIGGNFGAGDLHVQLKYIRKRGQPYRTEDEMRKDIAVFHRKMRAEYKKLGLEYKYIHVMEIGQKGARHHHMVIPAVDYKILQKHWKFARVTFTPLDSGDYRKLAEYLVKQTDSRFRDKTLMRQRYNCSHNLKQPEIRREKITRSSTYRRSVRPPKGYSLMRDTEVTGVDRYGHIFFKYTMVKIE